MGYRPGLTQFDEERRKSMFITDVCVKSIFRSIRLYVDI